MLWLAMTAWELALGSNGNVIVSGVLTCRSMHVLDSSRMFLIHLWIEAALQSQFHEGLGQGRGVRGQNRVLHAPPWQWADARQWPINRVMVWRTASFSLYPNLSGLITLIHRVYQGMSSGSFDGSSPYFFCFTLRDQQTLQAWQVLTTCVRNLWI